MANKVLYLIGSLRNKRVPELANRIRADNPSVEVFDDWYAAGPEADDCWKEYEKARGRSYQEALEGYAARNVFSFDKRNLDRASHALLVLPAGKSGHMEIMYATYGVAAKTAILLDPEDVRWDVMYQFVPTILNNDEEINKWLNSPEPNTITESPVLNFYRDRLLKEPPRYWVSEQENMPLIIGGEASSTAALLEQRCATSSRLMTEKTKTRKAR